MARSRYIDFTVDDREAKKLLDTLDSARERGQAIAKALGSAGKAGRTDMRGYFAASAFPSPRAKKGQLRSSLRFKAYAKSGGRTGVVVGPMGKTGAHRHLAEYGHRMVGRNGGFNGNYARPNPRAEKSRGSVERALRDTFVPALEQWVARIADKYK